MRVALPLSSAVTFWDSVSTDLASWVAGDDGTRRKGSSHYGAGSYYDTSPKRDARKHQTARADPAIVAELNRSDFHFLARAHRMEIGVVNAHQVSDLDAAPDHNASGGMNAGALINEDS